MKTVLTNRGLLFPKPAAGQCVAFTPYACDGVRRIAGAEVIMRDILAYLIGGEHVAANLGHIAAYFGVGLSTVKAWRQMGMPGVSGNYNLVDVLVWRIEKDAEGEHRPLKVLCCPQCEARR